MRQLSQYNYLQSVAVETFLVADLGTNHQEAHPGQDTDYHRNRACKGNHVLKSIFKAKQLYDHIHSIETCHSLILKKGN